MSKEIKDLENSELLAELFIARDDLISIRRRMYEEDTEELEGLFEIISARYSKIIDEVYRRLKK